MKYFHLRDNMSIPERWVLGDPLDESNQEYTSWYFEEGRRLDVNEPLTLQQIHPGKALDFSLTPMSIPVVHERVKLLLERMELRQQLQFLPVHVEGVSEPYFVVNAYRVIPCIDEVRSERVERWKPEDGNPEEVGQYRVVSGLRIDASKVGDVEVFRPWGWYLSLIVSERLKQALEDEGVTGTKFTEV